MSDLPDLEADEIEVRSGRTFPYATVGEWVLLAPISDRAVRLYCLLRMHCNGKRGDGRAWPSQTTMAKMLGIKKRQEVAQVIQTLVSLGAVDIEVVNHTRGRRNVYVVHEAPPEGYVGPVSRKDYYANQAKVPSSDGVVPPEGATPERGTTQSSPQGDENQLKGKLGSKSFSRDKSLEDELRARDVDQLLVEAGLKPGQEQSVDCEEVEGLWGQDQALFAGDQLGSSTAKTSAERDAEFEEFWTVYPRREKRADARRAWDKAVKKVGVATVMAGVARYVRHLAWWHPDSLDRNKHTAHPSSWLNGERWNDELPPEPTGQRKTSTNGHSSGYKPYSNPVDDSVYHEEIR